MNPGSALQQSADVRPELLEGVAADARQQPENTADRRLSERGDARRQPSVLDDVVDGVPGVPGPRGVQRAVQMLREKSGLDRIPRAPSDSAIARRNVAWFLAPE